VYADKCYYTVDRWERVRSLKSQGGLNDEPQWPALSLTRGGSALGSEREGPRHETYLVKLSSTDGKSYECEKPQGQWHAFVVGKTYPMKIRMIGGGADCGTLNP